MIGVALGVSVALSASSLVVALLTIRELRAATIHPRERLSIDVDVDTANAEAALERLERAAQRTVTVIGTLDEETKAALERHLKEEGA